MTDTETKAQELSRLVTEFDYGERQNRNEAWNLIAEFAYDNAEEICEALSASPKGDDLEPVADDLVERLREGPIRTGDTKGRERRGARRGCEGG